MFKMYIIQFLCINKKIEYIFDCVKHIYHNKKYTTHNARFNV